MKKIFVGYLKATGEKVFRYEIGMNLFYQTENTGMSTVNGLMKYSDIKLIKK